MNRSQPHQARWSGHRRLRLLVCSGILLGLGLPGRAAVVPATDIGVCAGRADHRDAVRPEAVDLAPSDSPGTVHRR